MSDDLIERLRSSADAYDERCDTIAADNMREAADRIESLTRSSVPLPESETAFRALVDEAMLDCWNDICSDSGCHPLDIEQLGRRKLGFLPRHWASQIAGTLFQRLQAAARQPLPESGLIDGEPLPTIEEVRALCEKLYKEQDQRTLDTLVGEACCFLELQAKALARIAPAKANSGEPK